ncbi:similar to Saccharomyces cerevisiae YOR165W SEY1 GTPase with a role in ER morphology [Maudiozyma barnettii]|uniref:Similar to Saccharomyces cerevisiae YOR165W SEY1 GTPase with a role in ER morphology n=1 Tax=Maudiozyma barnettii TaxID=61262 RepID=A0A8H2VH36_9SACH|nr:dynamin-like GTPase SEY1 [Kazachstania barnettii]CAB4255544.1 similar to Saccharomyces cerevisiae YOR165W SEY1 GTPase with a role in ER morphology [Kazachstania barnettii]CAD1784043.1 similar to Saccharomyces cerevisiae YOR165W SEY1 GTPase with a role in ER morphology [Kazachstania barnettii]
MSEEIPADTAKNMAVQLINEDKEFSQGLPVYFNNCLGGRDIDQNYHVISVFGSQSSGKSTLLNLLFNTNFDTMDAHEKRQQTTKGIWLSHTQAVNTNRGVRSDPGSDIFILDVEGSDGAERGEDQDFERKAALFAIAVSEVMIINLWEQQIGLYQGNNMGLLKTVFEVNLSLFGKNSKRSDASSHSQKHKMLLLFVIRDHIGVTPLESLSSTLTSELENIWKDLSKPASCQDSTIYDFFDLKFVGLSHKILRADKFLEDVKNLGDNFSNKENNDEYLFKPEFHHMLPLDGWSMYSENCWDQIENNKDLDLPTQQILVARFKTDEIMNETLTKYFENYDSNIKPLILENNKDALIEMLVSIKVQSTGMYDDLASRYTKQIYLENRIKLLSKINDKFQETIELFIQGTSTELIDSLKKSLSTNDDETSSFNEILIEISKDITTRFHEFISNFKEKDLINEESIAELNAKFTKFLNKKQNELRAIQVKSIISQFKKNMNFAIKDNVISYLANPSDDVWDRVMSFFKRSMDELLIKFETTSDNSMKTYDFQVGFTPELNDTIYKRLRYIAWYLLNVTVHDYLKEDAVIGILREKFENSFRYDENDTPILWKDENQIDNAFKIAKEQALNIFGVLCIAKTTDNTEIIPDVRVEDVEVEDDLGIYHLERFAHIINEIQKEKILRQFRRQINLSVLDAKRSMITTTTHIPIWVYALIVVLGWNEFMMILRNPLLITLLLLGVVGAYFVNKFDLWGPVLNVVNSAIGETRSTIKDKLRTFVLEEGELNQSNRKQAPDEYEMNDFKKEQEEEEEEKVIDEKKDINE